jgi:uncharacterized membrane protein
MTVLTANMPFPAFLKGSGKPGLDIGPRLRTVVLIAATAMTLAVLVALFRGLTGIAPAHPHIRHLAIVIHVATVLPAIPLGGYLLLARKGDALHKRLGKIWVGLMVATALSAIFIRSGGTFSFIHIFIPMTLWSSYKLIATARRGDMKGHRWEIVTLYFGALMIPGLVALLVPGRMLNTWLLG